MRHASLEVMIQAAVASNGETGKCSCAARCQFLERGHTVSICEQSSRTAESRAISSTGVKEAKSHLKRRQQKRGVLCKRVVWQETTRSGQTSLPTTADLAQGFTLRLREADQTPTHALQHYTTHQPTRSVLRRCNFLGRDDDVCKQAPKPSPKRPVAHRNLKPSNSQRAKCDLTVNLECDQD